MTVFRSRRAVLPSAEQPADVVVRDGRIVAVEPYGTVTEGELVDLGVRALLPGLADTHVHINEPGRTSWEGFATATRAAAAGGVTTVVDMPLNSVPPTTTVENLEVKRAAAAGSVHVDVGFWGGATGDNLADLEALHAAGVFGFKAFMSPSGVPEFPHLSGDQLGKTLAEIARLDALCVVHAEDPDVLAVSPAPAGPSYANFLRSRPPEAERAAVVRLVELARLTGARVHVLHVSSADVVLQLDAARTDGVRITAETCPHYLLLAADDIADGETAAKCCPPIRDAANRHALWQRLGAGLIELVVSDHSPCPPDLKVPESGDFGVAWGGISGLQLGLPAVWTRAWSRGYGLSDVARWMASGPAALVGLAAKGSLDVGKDADLVDFDPDAEFVVDPAALHHRHPVTAYAGRALRGVVRQTWLRGEHVDGTHASGRLLKRGS
ncbi:MAG TPA: allantoinase AllB [Jiangellaceae bacterium]|nr:allantoinase AllB [Jiangellaceae bacterium]